MKSSGGLRLLQLAAFFSSFDRFAVAPMLVTIAATFEASLARVAAAASLYYLLYGGMQPVWGMLSDRLGRVRVMRLTLLGAAIAGVLSALAPNLGTLIAARALAGGLFAAVIPAALVYVGDTVGMNSRQKALADLMAASAVGTALATFLGGLAAYLDAWRLAFATPALAGVALALLLTRLPEPEGFAAERKEGPLSQISRVLRRPWAVLVVAIAMVEGAVILGFLTFLAPSLESVGVSAVVAGLVVGLYGLAVLVWTRAVKGLADRLGAAALITRLRFGRLEPVARGCGRRCGTSGWRIRLHALHAPDVGYRGRARCARHGHLALRRRLVRREWGSHHGRGPAGGGRFLRPALCASRLCGRPFGTLCGSGAQTLF